MSSLPCYEPVTADAIGDCPQVAMACGQLLLECFQYFVHAAHRFGAFCEKCFLIFVEIE